MKRGDVFWAELTPRSGSEQSGVRPVVIISDDGFNQAPGWNSLIVIPLTTAEAQRRRGPTVVAIPSGTAGLTRGSVAICHQITTLDRSKVTQRIGAMPAEVMREIEQAIIAALDINF